jgi:hypothetical protein
MDPISPTEHANFARDPQACAQDKQEAAVRGRGKRSELSRRRGCSEIDAKLRMNHSIPGVNADYITRHKLLDDHLRRQRQATSCTVFAVLNPAYARSNSATLARPCRSPASHAGLSDWAGRSRGGSSIKSTNCLSQKCKRSANISEIKVGGAP